MTKMFKLMLSMMMVLFTISSVSAVNIVLSSQDPDPVAPGNFVYLNVKVTNQGSNSISNAILRFEENEVFQLAKGTDPIKEIGALPSYGLDTNNFVVSKFKVKVNENAPIGLNTVKVILETTKGDFEQDLEVLVQDDNLRLEVEEFLVDSLNPGDVGKLSIKLNNLNSISLNNVIVSLALDEVDSTVLNVKGGANEKVIRNLEGKTTQSVTFDIVASPSADSMPYTLPVDISYEDTFGNDYSTRVLGSVEVNSEPLISVNIDSQDIYTKGKGKVSLAIANPGTSTIKGTEIFIEESENYEVIEGDYEYVGDLNSDDFQTVQSELYFNAEDDFDLVVKLKYLDSYNNVHEKTLLLPIKIYDEDELKNFGLSASGNGSSSFGSIVFALILGVVGFFIGRKFKGKNIKKSLNK